VSFFIVHCTLFMSRYNLHMVQDLQSCCHGALAYITVSFSLHRLEEHQIHLDFLLIFVTVAFILH
jgi:hypothetical protein